MGSRGRRRAAASAMLVAATSPALPQPAVAVSQTLACEGNVTETFSPALTPMPSPGVQVSLASPTSLGCTGASAGTATLTSFAAFALAPATCAGPLVLEGSGDITFSSPPGSVAVTWVAVGTPQAQVWTFLSSSGPAVAMGAALEVPPDASCATAESISVVTLTAVVVIVAT